MAKKVALISGGTSGIGRAAVLQLLQDGFCVCAFAPSANKAKAFAKELAELFEPANFLVLSGDVRKEESLKKVVAATVKKFKRIDVLFNNAGYGFYTKPEEVDIKKYQDMMEVNMIGMARLTKLVVPQMKKQKSGLIINTASVAGRSVGLKGSFYSSTKFAVMGYSEGLRKDLVPYGIKVATVCPGMVKTNFFNQKEYKRRLHELWHGREPMMLQSEDVAAVIGFICRQPARSEVRDVFIMPFG